MDKVSIIPYPQNVTFRSTYENKISNFTIFLENVTHQQIEVHFHINGDSFFVLSDSVIIEGGSVFSLVICFKPSKIGKYSGSLEIQTNIIETISLHAECFSSPIEIVDMEINNYIFSSSNKQSSFSIVNNSLLEEFFLLITTNSSIMSLSEQEVYIKPLEKKQVVVSFDSFEKPLSNPIIIIECAQTNDSYSIALNVSSSKKVLNIDFGHVTSGQIISQTIKCPSSKTIKEPKSPFSIIVNEENISRTELLISDIIETDVIIKLDTQNCGEFQQSVEFEDYVFDLFATIHKPVYSIIRPKMIGDPLILQNNSNTEVKLLISTNEHFESHKIVSLSSYGKHIFNYSEDISQALYVRWSDGPTILTDVLVYNPEYIPDFRPLVREVCFNNEKNSDIIPLLNTGEESIRIQIHSDNPSFIIESTDLVLEPHSSTDVKITYVSKSFGKAEGFINIYNRSNGDVFSIHAKSYYSIVSSTSFIPAFQLDDSFLSRFSVTLTGNALLQLYGPEWVDIPKEVESGHTLDIEIRNINQTSIVENMIIESENCTPLSIPIVAYRGKSCIHVISNSYLKTENDITFFKVILINNGIRDGFAMFTSQSSQSSEEIKIYPISMIIPPNSSQELIVSFSNNLPIEDRQIDMHTGDEIIRYFYSYYRPLSSYSQLFGNVVYDSFEPFIDVLSKISKKELLKLSKRMITISTLIFDQKFEENPILISPMVLNFGNQITNQKCIKQIYIQNQTTKRINLVLKSTSLCLEHLYNLSIRAMKHAIIEISFCPNTPGLFKEEIQIECNQMYKGIVKIESNVEDPTLCANTQVLDFGNTQSGRLVRAYLRIANKKASMVQLTGKSIDPFILPIQTFEINPYSFVSLPVHFLPHKSGSFQEIVEFQTKENKKISIVLIGRASVDM